MSARRPSAASSSSASAYPLRRKRTAHGSSPASASERASASGSRSIPTSVPAGPRRWASSRAWPPSPKVQSIATWPGRGSSSPSSSSASTGRWPGARLRGLALLACGGAEPGARIRAGRRLERVISRSIVDTRGDLRNATEQRRSVLVPAVPAPQLEPVPGPHDHYLLLQPRVLAQEARHHDPARRVELGLERVAVDEALELAQLPGQRRQLRERAAAVDLIPLRLPDAYARLLVHGHRQHDAVRKRRAVAGRHREAVLCIERMVEGAAKGDHWGSKVLYRAGVEEWEEPLHPGSLRV